MFATPNQPLFYAVDFDRLIIHPTSYTWDAWLDTGRYTHPICQPIPAEYLETYRHEFLDFTDLRKKASVFVNR